MPEQEHIEIPTPFGALNMPFPKLPSLNSPNIDERRSKALGHALGEDLSMIVAIVPVLGDIIADVIEDLHAAELRKILTPSEFDSYVENNKIAPSTIAMLRSFMEK